jgi:glycosyltransferase involved in cell wall biosynthesis
MKILVLAWEFPPRIIGGIARHVAELYPEMVKLGHEVHLMTVETDRSPATEIVEGIHVYRVPVATGRDFFHWVGNMNQSMGLLGGQLLLEQGPFDLIHAHDWLVGDAAIALQYHFNLPLISTIHATEYGRHSGIFNDIHRHVDYEEKRLVAASWRVIVCTEYMRREVQQVLDCAPGKISVVYNGIRAEKKPRLGRDRLTLRRKFAADHEKILYYVGRITPEKGISVLLAATAQIVNRLDYHLRLVVIGGGNLDPYRQQAQEMGIGNHCTFTGFMDDRDLDRFQTIADCAVFPSLYEPFGIVALESFAARVPVVVSNAGGLPEVVRHQETGIVTQRNNAQSLAWGILEVLNKPLRSKQLVENATRDLYARFCWVHLAQQTEAVYQTLIELPLAAG